MVLGRKWHWRVDKLDVSGTPLRLLTAFGTTHEEFIAWLAVDRGESSAVIGRLEIHGTHPGWHSHLLCVDEMKIESGDPMYRDSARVPSANSYHRRTDYGITEADAISKAFGFFRVTGTPRGMLV